MFLSGTAALSYEICWIRMFALGLGHEMPAVVAVISAFLGGLAIGAWTLDGWIRRSASPARWYVALESVIGIWGLLTIMMIPWINDRIAWLTGPTPSVLTHWTVAFFVPLVALVPATAAMGATLPSMDQVVAQIRGDGRSVGAIYAANTLGAVLGTLGTTFLLLPDLGFRSTLLVAATINLSCAAAAWFFFASPSTSAAARSDTSGSLPVRAGKRKKQAPLSSGQSSSSSTIGLKRLAVALFVTGLLGIAYEVLGTRVIAQVLENTVYSFASVLSMYLLGTSLGAAAYHRWLRDFEPDRLLARLINLLAATCLIGVFVLSRSESIHASTLQWLGPGMGSAVATEATLAILVFGVPTFVMGTTFSLLAQMVRDRNGSVGRALGINTLGGALAAPLFGPVLLPLLGAKWALAGVSLGYLFLLPLTRRVGPVGLAVCAVLLMLVAPADLVFVNPLDGGDVLEHRDGVMCSVAVVTDQRGDRFLKVNDRFRMGSTANPANERRLGHIPLLLHPSPKNALFLGLGTGNTLAAAVVHPGLKAHAVELLPEVVAIQHQFSASTGNLQTYDSLSIHVSDARRYVRASRVQYDVIVADLFHPARDGSGALYTREHFQAVQRRLCDDGLFCQWLPLYQLDEYCLRIIIRTFLEVFPQTQAYLSTLDVNMPILGLVGYAQQRLYDVDSFNRRLENPPLLREVQKNGLASGLTLFGLALGSAERLQDFAGDAPINTDNHSHITFAAPRYIYSRQQAGFVNLRHLLADSTGPFEARHITSDAEFGGRLTRFVAARDVFLRAEIDRATGNLTAALDGYVLASEMNPEFDLAYTMAVLQARRLAEAGQRSRATEVLQRVIKTNPSRSEGKALLGRIQEGQ